MWWPRFFGGVWVRAIPNPNPNLLQAARLLLVAALHLDRLQQAAILRRQLELALVLERAHHDVLEGEEASGRLVLGRLEVVEYVARDDHVAILPRLYSAALLGQPPLAHRLDVVALVRVRVRVRVVRVRVRVTDLMYSR